MAFLLGLRLSPSTWGAEAPDEAIIRGKAEEVERLERELERAREELKHLQQGRSPVAAGSSLSGDAPPASQPAVGSALSLSTLPPLTAESVVTAEDLARHFLMDPAAAEERYRGKSFTIRGEIVGFHLPKFVRRFEVQLDTPGRFLGVICRFDYVGEFRTVYERDLGKAGDDQTKGRRR